MKKYIAILLILTSCISLSACDGTDYKKAEAQFYAQNYEAALSLYTVLGDYEDAAEKAKECKYQIGVLALEHMEWDKAISCFENSDYKDSSQKLADSQREKGMNEQADYSFLKALEQSIEDRRDQIDKDADYRTLVETELVILADFENKEFYDLELARIAKSYMDGLHTQENSLKKQYLDQQIGWSLGMIKRMHALNDLYNNYDFLKGDKEFERDYIVSFAAEEDKYLALKSIDSMLREQLTGTKTFDKSDYSTISDSKYSNSYNFYNWGDRNFDIQFYFTYYDDLEVRIYEDQKLFSNIKPNDNCKLEFYCPVAWNKCEYDWEIFPIN